MEAMLSNDLDSIHSCLLFLNYNRAQNRLQNHKHIKPILSKDAPPKYAYFPPRQLLQVAQLTCILSETFIWASKLRSQPLYPDLQVSYMTSLTDIAKDFFCGCVSGWTQVVVMLPFEHVKLKVVTRPDLYPTYFQAVKKTVLEEGVLAFYKGMLMPLLGVGAQVSFQFGTVETLKKIIKKRFSEADGSLHWKFSVLCGVLAGLPSAIIVTPLDHARFKVALRKEKGEGSVKIAQRIYKQHGFRKLYLGFNSTLLRESFIGVYFGTYDYCMKYCFQSTSMRERSLISGGLAGVATWSLMYPVDFVKTLIQSDSIENPQHRNAIECFRTEFKKSVKNVYRGFSIMICRAFCVNAAAFLAFELCKDRLYGKATS